MDNWEKSNMKSKLFTAIATITGTVIGAGFLGIPYVVAKSGFLIGLVHMVVLSIVLLIVNLMFGEIVLSTKVFHHISGYSAEYLGKKTKWIVLTASLTGFYAALVAYLIGEGESLSFILFGNLNYSIVFGIAFWAVMAFLTFGGVRSFRKIEPLGVFAVFIVTLILGIMNLDKINPVNLSYNNPAFLFAPFGVVVFAFLGMSAVPEIKRILGKNQELMKKSIIIGSLIPLFVYILFTLVVMGLYGANVAEVATISFGKIASLLGVLTMFSAFFALSLELQDTYRFDAYMHEKLAWALGIFVPLLIFLAVKIFNLAGFTKILGFGGAISGGLMAIAILLIHENLQLKKKLGTRKPEFRIKVWLWLKVLFILLFIAGILFEFL